MPEIKLHHLRNSRSQRVVWLLEEIYCEYDLIEHADIVLRGNAIDPPSFKYPTLQIIDEASKTYLSETSAICEYLTYQGFVTQMFESESHAKWVKFKWQLGYEDALIL